MDFESIRSYCLAKKSVVEETPFGPSSLVFKVGGKMFTLLSFSDENLSINLKNKPEVNLELREEYSFITPGYHMNKKHWNTLSINHPIDPKLLYALIDQSYDLVIASLPKKVKTELEAQTRI